MLLMLQTINHLMPSFLPELTLKGFLATIVFQQKIHQDLRITHCNLYFADLSCNFSLQPIKIYLAKMIKRVILGISGLTLILCT